VTFQLIDSAIKRVHHPPDLTHTLSDSAIRIITPYKDRDLGRKIDHELQPIFTSKKIVDNLRETELKPPIDNQRSLVFQRYLSAPLSEITFLQMEHFIKVLYKVQVRVSKISTNEGRSWFAGLHATVLKMSLSLASSYKTS